MRKIEIENKQIKPDWGSFGGPAPVKDEPKEEPKKDEEVADEAE